MAARGPQRALRQQVEWPARIRGKGHATWYPGRVVNLSVTGALLQIEHRYPLGELVEVEIDFLNRPDCQTVVAGNGYIVREHRPIPNSSAVHFETGCSIAQRRGSETPADKALGNWRGPMRMGYTNPAEPILPPSPFLPA